MEEMTSKEFDLLIDLVLTLLEQGQVDKVIELLRATKSQKE